MSADERDRLRASIRDLQRRLASEDASEVAASSQGAMIPSIPPSAETMTAARAVHDQLTQIFQVSAPTLGSFISNPEGLERQDVIKELGEFLNR